MQKEEEGDPKNIWKPNILMSWLKWYHAEDCTGVRKIRCSKSTAGQKSFQDFNPFHLSKLKHTSISLSSDTVLSPPLPAEGSARGTLHRWLISTSQCACKREVWAGGRGKGSEKAGATEKRDSDLPGLKSPA